MSVRYKFAASSFHSIYLCLSSCCCFSWPRRIHFCNINYALRTLIYTHSYSEWPIRTRLNWYSITSWMVEMNRLFVSLIYHTFLLVFFSIAMGRFHSLACHKSRMLDLFWSALFSVWVCMLFSHFHNEFFRRVKRKTRTRTMAKEIKFMNAKA